MNKRMTEVRGRVLTCVDSVMFDLYFNYIQMMSSQLKVANGYASSIYASRFLWFWFFNVQVWKVRQMRL